jgi:hypothetical protein
MEKVKFFTTPPRPYPYVLINVIKPKYAPLRHAQEVIIDSGVEIFRDPSVKDYPRGHINKLIKVFMKAKAITNNKPILVTVPDYPDDYHPKSLWLSENYTNIERTVDNVLKYTEQYKWIPWLIPIQGWNKNPKSILRSIELYKEHGITDKFDYFAIANLCVEPDTQLIYKTVALGKQKLPDKKLHVFGLKLNALKHIYNLIYSFDSLAWTRPVDHSGHSCKTTQERIEYFEKWLNRFESITKTRNSSIEKFFMQ